MGERSRLVCRNCEGEGRIAYSNSHMEMCRECLGLGFVEVEGGDSSLQFIKRRKPLMHAVYYLSAAMGIFYVFYLWIIRSYHISFSYSLAILLTAHTVGIGGFFLYLLAGMLKGKEGY